MMNSISYYFDNLTSSPVYDYSEYYNSGVAEGIPCTFSSKSKYFLPVFYSLFFVVGLVGNMLVLWVILRGAQMKSMTDVSLLNLAIADLLLIFTLPFLAHYARDTWVFGDAMCKLVLGVYYIGFYAGIFFIVLMSIDRYLAIVHSVFALRIHTKTYGILASLIIWIIAIAVSFPELVYLSTEKNDTKIFCTAYANDKNKNKKIFAYIKMNILGLLIPLIIVGYCYSMVLRKLLLLRASKNHSIHLVAGVMVVFFCCWTPYIITVFIKALELQGILSSGCELSQNIHLMLQVTEAIAYSHSCLNPFLYKLWGKSSGGTSPGSCTRHHVSMCSA